MENIRATEAQILAGREKRREKVASWKTLDLKLDWLDDAYMRRVLHHAGLAVIPPINEPATVRRLRQLGRRIGLTDAMLRERAGHGQSGPLTLEQFLQRNARMPLWVAFAYLVEAGLSDDVLQAIAQRLEDEDRCA